MRDELATLEQRWGLALQSAQFGIWDLDVPQQLVHYSPQWKALLGYDASAAPDATALWRARVHPDDLPRMLDALTDYLGGTADSYDIEFRLRAADGSYRWVLSRGRVVERDAQGQPLRVIGTLTDLTDRRQAEALRIERDSAQAAHRAKTEFLSRMSHELRTPLNAVLGFAQLLSQQIGGGDIAAQRRGVAQIERAGWQLLTMINDVLDLSRIEAGRLAMDVAPVTVAPVLRSVCETMAASALARQIGITTHAPEHATVQADASRLKQVISHLLGNAIRYNRDGGSVAIALTPEAGGWTLAMTDTGLGIAAGQMPHLFEPFNRLGRADMHQGGVGIGLVLARSLVESMGGRVQVRSTEGVGSCFELWLPAATPG